MCRAPAPLLWATSPRKGSGHRGWNVPPMAPPPGHWPQCCQPTGQELSQAGRLRGGVAGVAASVSAPKAAPRGGLPVVRTGGPCPYRGKPLGVTLPRPDLQVGRNPAEPCSVEHLASLGAAGAAQAMEGRASPLEETQA